MARGRFRYELVEGELKVMSPAGSERGGPALAVEVMSPGDAAGEVAEKSLKWLEAGALAVWVVDPKERAVAVYRSPEDVSVLGGDDELEGGEVVPGFRCKESEIFV